MLRGAVTMVMVTDSCDEVAAVIEERVVRLGSRSCRPLYVLCMPTWAPPSTRRTLSPRHTHITSFHHIILQSAFIISVERWRLCFTSVCFSALNYWKVMNGFWWKFWRGAAWRKEQFWRRSGSGFLDPDRDLIEEFFKVFFTLLAILFL